MSLKQGIGEGHSRLAGRRGMKKPAAVDSRREHWRSALVVLHKIASLFSLYNLANFTPREQLMIGGMRAILVAVLTVVLSAYGLDCFGITAPEQSMQCCNRMHCHSPRNHHSHQSMDCCDTMPQMHSSLGHPSSVQGVSLSPVVLGLVLSFSDPRLVEGSCSIIAAHSHDPPLSCIPVTSPLRI